MSNVTAAGLHPDSRHPNGPADTPSLVTLHVWGVPIRYVPTAVGRMAVDRLLLRGAQGLRFAKLLGTADGSTFASRDTDPRHWGLLACWDHPEQAENFEHSRTARSWRAFADETLRVRMTPIASRGTWAGQEPFGAPAPVRVAGPIAALTRARIKPSMWRTFGRAVPPVASDLARYRGDGLALALGIGESPIGLQGTFSVWSGTEALRAFAHRGEEHQRAVRATDELGWYSEELFARFAVHDVRGTYRGETIDP